MQPINEQHRIYFKDIIGLEAEKKELNQLIEILNDPDKFTKFGGTLPKGILVYGPTGTGKTMLIRALSNEIDIPFYPVTADKMVFENEEVAFERLKDVFELASKNTPSVIYIDEIDSFLDIDEGGPDNRLFNQILTLMDGFYQNERVIVIATTSRYDFLPHSLLRPGRFDKHIRLSPPNLPTRSEALTLYTKHIDMDKKLSLHQVACALQHKTLPEIKHIVNEVILNHVSSNKSLVLESDFYDCIEKVEFGLIKEDQAMTVTMKRRVAIHETGHAMMQYVLNYTTKLLRISLHQRSIALGNIRVYADEGSNNFQTKDSLYNEIKVGLSGLVCEEVILGSYTNGSRSDIEGVTEIAYKMVMEYGMSDLGPVFLNTIMKDHFFRELSQATNANIDNEVSAIIHRAYHDVKTYFQDNKDLVNHLVDNLMEKKVLLEEQLKQLIDNYNKTNQTI